MSSQNPQQNIDDELELKVVQEEDRERVLEFFRKFFFTDEPLFACTEPKEKASEEGEQFILSFGIPYGTSIMAVRKQTNELVGVCLAGPQGCYDADRLFEESAKEGNTKWGKLVKFMACIERDAKVGKRYGVQKILYIIGTCVDSSMRGKNLGTRLYNAVKYVGNEKNYQLLRADCTSYYSAKIKERLGWDCINTLYYKDYVDEKNRPIFSPASPHECCKSYALRL